MTLPMPSEQIMQILRKGVAIPASPLALDANRRWDEKSQRTVYRYYAAAGAGGIAVGVHTTQFEIRKPEIGLFEPLLKFAAQEIDAIAAREKKILIKIAGVCGKTPQAVKEAELAKSFGYDMALLSLGAMKEESEDELIAHCQEVSKIIPLIGFYLQPAVGGRILPFDFWRRFAAIENVVAIKMAPFNRYQTLDVIRGTALSGRAKEITLYTGNDDNIIIDLMTPFKVQTPTGEISLRIKGGLLGQWAVWTQKAVKLLEEIHGIIESGKTVPEEMLTRNAALTDANGVVFDTAHQFAGCIPGINEVLRRQGILPTNYCLNPNEVLSPGQAEELDRINREYPFLIDDDFITAHLDEWKR
jgi:hypothetical protein